MLPYLIAGAIGFGIGKLFENGGEAGEKYVNGGGVGKYKMYKLRAEGLNDFINFLGTGVYFNIKSFTVEPIGVPDVVVSFETNLSLSEIKAKLREVKDSHVMLDTIKPIKEYTGERYVGGGGVSYRGRDIDKIKVGDIVQYANSNTEYEAEVIDINYDSQFKGLSTVTIKWLDNGKIQNAYLKDLMLSKGKKFAGGGVAKKRRRSVSAQ